MHNCDNNEAISPIDFIPIAEETGLINQLGLQMLIKSCEVGKKLLDGGTPTRMSVNVAAKQFANPHFPTQIKNALTQTQLPSHLLQLEVTESTLMSGYEATKETLLRIKELGVSISIDDFGTGYSSLSYLKSFPIDEIKIDRTFVRDMEKNDLSYNIVKTIVCLRDGEIQKVDYLIYDIAGGVDQIETDQIARDSLNGFITVELANDLDSKNNALDSIRDMALEEIAYTKRFLTSQGYDVEKIPADKFNAMKEQIGFTYTYIYSKNYQGAMSVSDPKETVAELKKLEAEFGIKIDFLILPCVKFNELKKRGLSYLTTREEAKAQGHSIGRVKTIEKHPEFQEFMTDFIKS